MRGEAEKKVWVGRPQVASEKHVNKTRESMCVRVFARRTRQLTRRSVSQELSVCLSVDLSIGLSARRRSAEFKGIFEDFEDESKRE